MYDLDCNKRWDIIGNILSEMNYEGIDWYEYDDSGCSLTCLVVYDEMKSNIIVLFGVVLILLFWWSWLI